MSSAHDKDPRAQVAHEAGSGREALPSLAVLQAFEASLRHRSFTAAARELGLTQGAVSRHVARLEQQLGHELFHRERPRVRPTRAAQQFGAKLRRVLDRLEGLVSAARSNAVQDGGLLELACLPTLGTHWLIPRLPDFRERHPEVSIQLTTSLQVFDFDTEEVDCAIHYGTGVWPGARSERLMDERMVVVANADLASDLSRPEDLAGLPLLRLASRPWAWPSWFAENGPRLQQLPKGPTFEHHVMLLEAAKAGLGVTLLPTFVAGPALAAGSVVEPFPGRSLATRRSYWLVYPDRTLELAAFQAFRRWLRERARG